MLKGKATLITGSTSGIGLGIARALAQQGADIVLNGFGAAAVIENLRKKHSDEFKVGAIYAPWRRSRISPSTAGIAIIAINLSAAFHTIRTTLPQMLERNWGRITVIEPRADLSCSPW